MANADEKQKIRQRYKGIALDEIEKIPAIEEKDIFDDDSYKRVGVYARVSTDDPRQTSSFELQRNHYTDLIDRRPGWHLYRIYADEGISGTSLKHRDAFCALITELTGWNLNNRYKMIGKMVRNRGDRLFIFDLNAPLIYPKKSMLDSDGKVIPGKITREPVYMETWRHQFGLPVEEHERTYAINRIEDYVVISVQGQKSPRPMKPQLDRKENT